MSGGGFEDYELYDDQERSEVIEKLQGKEKQQLSNDIVPDETEKIDDEAEKRVDAFVDMEIEFEWSNN